MLYLSGNGQLIYNFWLLRTLLNYVIVLPDINMELHLANGHAYTFALL